MTTDGKKKQGVAAPHLSTTLLAILTLVVTIISAVPSILSLNTPKEALFYSVSERGVEAPPDQAAFVESLLVAHSVPPRVMIISLVNQGNDSADSVRIRVRCPSNILSVATDPPGSPKPLWVDIASPEYPDSQTLDMKLSRMGVANLCRINVGYSGGNRPDVEIYSSRQQVRFVEDASDVPAWSSLDTFNLPLKIFGVGLLLVVLWTVVMVLVQNPVVRRSVFSFLVAVLVDLVVVTPIIGSIFAKGVDAHSRKE